MLCLAVVLLLGVACASHVVPYDNTIHHRKYTHGLPRTPIIHHNQLGMYHIELSGAFTIKNKQVVVDTLTYLKVSTATNGSLIWHGRTIVFDPTRLTLEHGLYPHHISPNDIVFETQPRIFFRQAEHVFIKPGVEHEHNFTLLEPIPIAEEKLIKDGQPWVLHMCMDDMPHEFELYFSVNDWQYTTLLSSSVVSLSHYIEPYSTTINVYAALTPLYQSSWSDAARHVVLYTKYHAELGFNATILYERGPYLRHLFKDAAVDRLLHAGDLKVMMWDQGTARAPLWSKQIFSDGAKQYAKFDQIVIFDHILTALYGTNSYVYISDHDEFLVLPQSVAHPRVHNSIINGCLWVNRTSYYFGRLSFPECRSADVMELWQCLLSSEATNPDVHKSMHYVDYIHSTQMHFPKGSVLPHNDQADWVQHACGYIAHMTLSELVWS